MVVSASKRRPRWEALPASVRSAIEGLVGGRVAEAAGCAGGFSPGLASRLRLSDGRWVFVKGMDGVRWPHELAAYRDEARVAAALPEDFPAPRLIGSAEHDGWLLLAFAHVDGREPVTPGPRPS